ncbi:MAG: GNAT family protein [Pseudomonadota bacterium]
MAGEEPILGAVVERLPSGERPARAPIVGRRITLEPVDPATHGAELYALSHGDADPEAEIWTYMPYGPFPEQASFEDWLKDRQASEDPLFFALRDHKSGKAAGMASYLRITPEMGVIEIGHIWFAPALQRTAAATEALFLMARLAFDELSYRRLEWKCNALNEGSRQAALRLGFTFEGIFRQHLIVKGRNRDSAWYSILDGEWPRLRGCFEEWLAEENFDEAGKQKVSLSALTRASD